MSKIRDTVREKKHDINLQNNPKVGELLLFYLINIRRAGNLLPPLNLTLCIFDLQ